MNKKVQTFDEAIQSLVNKGLIRKISTSIRTGYKVINPESIDMCKSNKYIISDT